MTKTKKAKSFNVKTLEIYKFVENTVKYFEKILGLKVECQTKQNRLKLYKGTIKKKGAKVSTAMVGYGGSGKNLRDLPTPLQTELLSVVFGHWYDTSKGQKNVPLLVLGHSFDEVFLRKIRLLNKAIPDIRLIQYINVRRFDSIERRLSGFESHCRKHLSNYPKIKSEIDDFQAAVVDFLKSGGELSGRKYDVLDCEVPAGEGTKKSEMIDIIALERRRRWLTVIELKFERLNSARLESSIFQGLDYCNWVEEHKRGLAMLFSCSDIDTRRRTRLIFINGPHKFPQFHRNFAKACARKDRYQEIELYYSNDSYPLSIKLFAKTGEESGLQV